MRKNPRTILGTHRVILSLKTSKLYRHLIFSEIVFHAPLERKIWEHCYIIFFYLFTTRSVHILVISITENNFHQFSWQAVFVFVKPNIQNLAYQLWRLVQLDSVFTQTPGLDNSPLSIGCVKIWILHARLFF